VDLPVSTRRAVFAQLVASGDIRADLQHQSDWLSDPLEYAIRDPFVSPEVIALLAEADP
jgi:hypothetical protein